MPHTDPVDDVQLDQLRKAITSVRRRGLHNLPDSGGHRDVEELKLLDEFAVEYTVAEPDLSRRDRLRRLLTASTEKIEDDENGDAEAHRDRSLRSLGLLDSLAHITSPEDLLSASVNARHEQMLKQKTRDDYYYNARRAHAAGVLRLIQEVRLRRRLVQEAPFVPRLELSKQFDALIEEAGLSVICFVGPRGAGKSRLARSLVEQVSKATGRDFINLVADSEDSLYRDIANFMAKQGFHYPGKPRIELIADFLAAIGALRNPIIILDDVYTWESIRLVVPDSPRALYVVTSNSGELPIPERAASIDVVEMAVDEATQMVRNLIPADLASMADCKNLAVALSCLPLAIDHASNLISDGHWTVQGFIRQQQLNAAAAHSTTGPRKRRSLTWIYEEILDTLRRESVQAFYLLGIIARVLPSRISRELLSRTHEIQWQKYGDSERISSEYAFVSGLVELQRRRLVIDEDGLYRIHPLTSSIVADLLRADDEETVLSIVTAFDSAIPEASVPLDRLPVRLNLQVPHVASAIYKLMHVRNREQWGTVRFGRVISILSNFIPNSRFRGDFVRHVDKCLKLADRTDRLDDLELRYAILGTNFEDTQEVERWEYVEAFEELYGKAIQLGGLEDTNYRGWLATASLDALLINADIADLDEYRSFVIEQLSGTDWEGDGLLRIAEADIRLGQYERAAKMYEQSWRIAVEASSHQVCINLRALALAGMVRCNALLLNREKQLEVGGKLIDLLSNFDALEKQRTDGSVAADGIEYWVAHAATHHACAYFLAMFVMGAQTYRGGRDDRYSSLVNEAERQFNLARDVYSHLSGRRKRYMIALEYDFVRFSVIQHGPDLGQLLEKVDGLIYEAEEIEEYELALRLSLLKLKLIFLMDPQARDLRSLDMIRQCMDLAYEAANEYELRSLYNEAVMLASFVAIPTHTANSSFKKAWRDVLKDADFVSLNYLHVGKRNFKPPWILRF
jgi:hypothetical protein